MAVGRFFRCDGCGGEIIEPATEGRHGLDGDGVPPPRFEWCRLCSRVAFAAVAAGRRGPRALPAGPPVDGGPTVVFTQGRAGPPVDDGLTREMPPPQPVTGDTRLDQLGQWVRRRGPR